MTKKLGRGQWPGQGRISSADTRAARLPRAPTPRIPRPPGPRAIIGVGRCEHPSHRRFCRHPRRLVEGCHNRPGEVALSRYPAGKSRPPRSRGQSGDSRRGARSPERWNGQRHAEAPAEPTRSPPRTRIPARTGNAAASPRATGDAPDAPDEPTDAPTGAAASSLLGAPLLVGGRPLGRRCT